MGEAQRRYYMNRSDEEIEEMIKDLSSNQKKMFDIALTQDDDRRGALFIAGSYSIEEKI